MLRGFLANSTGEADWLSNFDSSGFDTATRRGRRAPFFWVACSSSGSPSWGRELVPPIRKRAPRSRVSQCERRLAIRGYVFEVFGDFCNAFSFFVFGISVLRDLPSALKATPAKPSSVASCDAPFVVFEAAHLCGFRSKQDTIKSGPAGSCGVSEVSADGSAGSLMIGEATCSRSANGLIVLGFTWELLSKRMCV